MVQPHIAGYRIERENFREQSINIKLDIKIDGVPATKELAVINELLRKISDLQLGE